MARSGGSARKQALRVAVVDDHRLVLDGIVAHLTARRPGFDVVISESTWHGLVSHPDFPVDIVVLDLNLDDNIPIATKIRALNAAGASTVVISRHADASSIHGALRAGALAFVPKTETADELITAVQAAAEGRLHVAASVSGVISSVEPLRDPGLGKQEHRALVLYAAGRSIKEVAAEMETTEETVKSYIKRSRRKYRAVGIDVGTKILLRRHGIREGWLTPE